MKEINHLIPYAPQIWLDLMQVELALSGTKDRRYGLVCQGEKRIPRRNDYRSKPIVRRKDHPPTTSKEPIEEACRSVVTTSQLHGSILRCSRFCGSNCRSLDGSLISPQKVKSQDSLKTHEDLETLDISWKSQLQRILRQEEHHAITSLLTE
jgi:hypothetical protein